MRSSLNIDSLRPPHEDVQRSNSLPNAGAIETLETPSRAQRPNFLQISDADYFGAPPLSHSSPSASPAHLQHQTSSGSSTPQRRQHSDEGVSTTHQLHNQTGKIDDNGSDNITVDLERDYHHKDHNSSPLLDRPGYNENNNMHSSAGQHERHQPLHRLQYTDYGMRRQQSGSFDSQDGSLEGLSVHERSPPHRHRDSYRHDVTNDYYLSEEEELAMIAHQARHSNHSR